MNEINNTPAQEHDAIEKERIKHVLEGFRQHLTEPLSPFSILECETAIRAIETLEKIRNITTNFLGSVDSNQDETEESEYCEWIKYDYRTLVPRNHDTKNPYWRIPENMDKLKYCPYCGKEIKVVDD